MQFEFHLQQAPGQVQIQENLSEEFFRPKKLYTYVPETFFFGNLYV